MILSTLELFKQHRAGSDRYTYFLLAVSGSAVVYAMEKTDGMLMTLSLLPLGLAVLCFGLSFAAGVMTIVKVQTAAGANYSLAQLRGGTHPDQPPEGALREAAESGVLRAIAESSGSAKRYGDWQFRLLIAGAVLFVAWHVLAMYLRTIAESTA